jgi:hypothetical protein
LVPSEVDVALAYSGSYVVPALAHSGSCVVLALVVDLSVLDEDLVSGWGLVQVLALAAR